MSNELNSQKVKVLLIMPPYRRLKGYFTRNFSLGLGYIGAVLERDGYEVKIYCGDNNRFSEVEENYNKYDMDSWQADMRLHQRFAELFEDPHNFDPVWNEVREVIKDFSPQVVGITASTANYLCALVIAKIAKEIDSKMQIVFGGAHPTVMPAEVLSEENVDFVVRGEGEDTFLELLNALYRGNTRLEEVKGLSFKAGGQLIHNPARECIEDLDRLPFPARHLLINNFGDDRSSYQILFRDILVSRGCPYHCKFCAANSVWGKKWRTRSVGNVIKEIKMLRDKYLVNYFEILSDTLGVRESWMIGFCQSISSLNVTWGCTTRINKLNENILKLMKDSGCVQAHIGIESGSDQILKTINKGITVAQVKQAGKILNQAKIPWGTFFMMGFPEESRKEILDTFRLIKQLKPKFHKIAVLAPYPGTSYYEELKSEGRLPEKINWNYFDGRSSYLSFARKIPEDEFLRLRNKILRYVDRYNNRGRGWKEVKLMASLSLKLIRTDPLGLMKKASGFALKKIKRTVHAAT